MVITIILYYISLTIIPLNIFIKLDIEKIIKCHVYKFFGHPGLHHTIDPQHISKTNITSMVSSLPLPRCGIY